MKISYVVALQRQEGLLSKGVLTEWDYHKVESFSEAQKLNKGCIDKKTHSVIKILESNTDFQNEVLKIRKKLQIPKEGYHWDKWQKIAVDNRWKLNRSSRKEISESILKKFMIPIILKPSLVHIVIGSWMYLPIKIIEVEDPYSSFPVQNEIRILIRKRISKNQFLKYIRENWAEFDNAMTVFSEDEYHFISSRDRRIISLRENNGMKFAEIADLLAEELGDYDLNEDSIKTAYHRAKDVISKLRR